MPPIINLKDVNGVGRTDLLFYGKDGKIKGVKDIDETSSIGTNLAQLIGGFTFQATQQQPCICTHMHTLAHTIT